MGASSSRTGNPYFEPRFLFRGQAIGLSGHLRRHLGRRQEQWIGTFGSVSLPITGGRAEQTVSGRVERDGRSRLLEFRRISVEAVGDFSPPAAAVAFTHGNAHRNRLPAVTTVRTEIEGFKIWLNGGAMPRGTPPVAFDHLRVTWKSIHARKGGEPNISLDVRMRGLTIAGRPIRLVAAKGLLGQDTFGKLKHAAKPGSVFWNEHCRHFGVHARAKMPIQRGGPDKAETSICRIFEDLSPTGFSGLPVTVHDYWIEIEDFGKIYFGEMVISPADRRLTVMRMEVGSPKGGDITVGGSGTNGTEWPP